MKTIAIVGTRDYSHVYIDPLFAWLGGWLQKRQREAVQQKPTPAMPPVMIVSGDGGNVDLAAKAVFLETYKLPFMAFPADWHGPLKKRSGPIRNSYIATMADAGIAIHDGYSRGTLDTINNLKQRGMPTLIAYPHQNMRKAASEIRDFLKDVLE